MPSYFQLGVSKLNAPTEQLPKQQISMKYRSYRKFSAVFKADMPKNMVADTVWFSKKFSDTIAHNKLKM